MEVTYLARCRQSQAGHFGVDFPGHAQEKVAQVVQTDTSAHWQDTIISFVIQYGLKILGAIVILIVGLAIARTVGKWCDSWLSDRHLEPPIRLLFVRLIRVAILAVVSVVVLDQIGVQIAPLVAGLGVAGGGVGLATQGVLGNLIAGLTIIFTKPFRVGEYVELLGVYGQVTNIEVFSTKLVHADRSVVTIPNRKIIGEILHNYGTIRQLDLTVGVAYSTNMPQAIRTVQRILDANPHVLKDPAAVV